jgi:hypothetical protein
MVLSPLPPPGKFPSKESYNPSTIREVPQFCGGREERREGGVGSVMVDSKGKIEMKQK